MMRLLILIVALSLWLDFLTALTALKLSRILSQTFGRKKSTAHFVVHSEGADENPIAKPDDILNVALNMTVINEITSSGGGCYLSTITIDNPPQDVLFLVDTHSADTWTVPASAAICLNIDPGVILFSGIDTAHFYSQLEGLPLRLGFYGIQAMSLFDSADDGHGDANKNEDKDKEKEKEVQDDPSFMLLGSAFLRSAATPGPEHSSGRNSTVAIRLAFLATVMLVL